MSAVPASAEAGSELSGPVPGSPPGDPGSPNLPDTYPWFAANEDLSAKGYVEQEFYLSGQADAYAVDGTLLESDVPYKTRIVVRRPIKNAKFNGTVLVEWQNVTAGYDLDALWSREQLMREGYAWVGVSAQRVGVDQLRGWSATRYGELDVTGGRRFVADELSYEVFAQAAAALRKPRGADPLARLDVDTVLGIGASQSAGRMVVYYDGVRPKTAKVFDGYAFVVGPAPAQVTAEPVLHVLSETDVRSPVRAPDTDTYRRWEVAGSAHSGWYGQEYRRPILTRDLGSAPTYNCAQPPFSRVPLHHVLGAAYGHLSRWVRHGDAPPSAPPLEFEADGVTKARDELGLARGGIRLSQVTAPTALNTGDNAGETFCRLFGTHIPFSAEVLNELYPSKGSHVSAVAKTDLRNVRAGYLLPGDAHQNLRDALDSGVPPGTP